MLMIRRLRERRRLSCDLLGNFIYGTKPFIKKGQWLLESLPCGRESLYLLF